MFTYILYGLAGTGLAISFFKDRNKTKTAMKKAWKSFENILPQFLSILIIDWGLDDPTGKSDEEFNKTIDLIEHKLLELMDKILTM